MRAIALLLLTAGLPALAGCGYHTLGAATHLPPEARTLAVPVFTTKTDTYHTEAVMTEAVLREFVARSRLRVTPDENGDPDMVLHGTILQETVAPLTYNTSTQQSSSFLITVSVAVQYSYNIKPPYLRLLYNDNLKTDYHYKLSITMD